MCWVVVPLWQVRLAVAGAFHTAYMQPAVEQLRAALEGTPIVCPRIPVVSNVDAKPHSSPEAIKAILARQARPPAAHARRHSALLHRSPVVAADGLISAPGLAPGTRPCDFAQCGFGYAWSRPLLCMQKGGTMSNDPGTGRHLPWQLCSPSVPGGHGSLHAMVYVCVRVYLCVCV